jgi:hypothetical protein
LDKLLPGACEDRLNEIPGLFVEDSEPMCSCNLVT